jgi:hypothetical protein
VLGLRRLERKAARWSDEVLASEWSVSIIRRASIYFLDSVDLGQKYSRTLTWRVC